MNKKEQILYGLHTIQAVLEKQPQRILRLCVLQQREDHKLKHVIELADSLNIHIDYCSKLVLDNWAEQGNHQGMLAFCQPRQTYTEQELGGLLEQKKSNPFVLVLDGVQDPHNLGACFRSAEAAGVDLLIVPKDKSVGLTATVSKVACGATETLPFVQVTNLVRGLKILKEHGLWIYGTAMDGEHSLFQTTFSTALALVMGAEGAGLRHLTKQHCDQLISIPLKGSVNSLNVSVATAICLFEVVRQRS